MRRSSLAMALVGALILTAFGCAHLGGPSDSELINEMLSKWTEANKARDIDAAVSLISANFKHEGYDYEAEGKDAMRAFMEEGIAAGNYDELEIVYDAELIEIEGDTALVPDIQWNCAPGTAYIELKLKKEDGAWRIIDAAVEEM